MDPYLVSTLAFIANLRGQKSRTARRIRTLLLILGTAIAAIGVILLFSWYVRL